MRALSSAFISGMSPRGLLGNEIEEKEEEEEGRTRGKEEGARGGPRQMQ